ncbi:MAG: hypothetical protein ACI4PL_06655 [Faecousia sp.]
MFEKEKDAFDRLDQELRRMNDHAQEDDLAELKALLDKDYTKPQPPRVPAPWEADERISATGHENRELRSRSQELLREEDPQEPIGSRRKLIPLVLLAVVELIALAAVAVWWIQWMRW